MALNLYSKALRSIRSGIVHRSLSSQNNDKYQRPSITSVSLEKEIPNLPKGIYVQKPKIEAASNLRVTKLSNGLTVASEPKFGQFCTVGK